MNLPDGGNPAASSNGWQFPQAIGVEAGAVADRFRQGSGAASSAWLAEPSAFVRERNELQRDRAEALAEAGSSFRYGIRPASALRPPSRFALWRDKSQRYGAASFASFMSELVYRAEARPKGERRLVDQNSASWNRLHEWLSRLDAVRRAA